MNKQRILKQTTRLAVCLSLLLAAGCSDDAGDKELADRKEAGELVDIQTPERSWNGQHWSRVQTTTGAYYVYTMAHGTYGEEVNIRTYKSGEFLCITGNSKCWKIIGS